MNRKNLLRVSTILLIVVVGFAHSYDDDGYNVDDDDGYGSSKYGDDGYDDGGVYSYIGWSGKDPRKDGIDIGDYGPVFGKNDSMLAKMNFWITAVDDWEEKGSRRYGSGKYGSNKYGSNKYGSNKYDSNKYGSNKYGSNKYDSDKYDSDKYDSDNYDSDNYDSGEYGSGNYNSGKNYKGGQRRKRSYTKVTFPVKQVKNYKKFPFHRFPPLISIAPWLPIFYDKLTYQTFIFSPTGGLYIIPPLINFYGQRFAVAQLVKWGYASLVSSGVPPPPAVNVAPLVSPAVPVGGAPVGGAPVGGAPVAGAPAKKPVEYKNVNTNFPQFRPRPDYLQKNINNVPNNNAPGPYSG